MPAVSKGAKLPETPECFHMGPIGFNILPKGLILIDSAAYKVKLPFFVSYLRTPILGYALLNFPSPEFQAEYTLKKLYYDKRKVTDERIARYAYFMEKEGHNNTMLECAKHIVPENVEYYTSRYKNIDIPALVIWGKNDTALPVSSAYKLSEELQESKLVIIDKCGHIQCPLIRESFLSFAFNNIKF